MPIVVALAVGLLLVALPTGGLGPLSKEPATEETTLEIEPVIPASVTVPILVYHNIRPVEGGRIPEQRSYDVTPGEFREQMEWLVAQGYETILFRELLACLHGEFDLPEKPVVISFDDGRRNQLENALSVLDELGLHATFFVFTNAPDRNPDYFTWAELATLKANGHEIGSHTQLHAYMTKADDETMMKELRASYDDIKENLGEAPVSLAWPFGLNDERTETAAATVGYGIARSLRHDYDFTPTEALDLPGFIVTGDMEDFVRIMSGGNQ